MLRAILVLIMLAALAALPACDTLNIGGSMGGGLLVTLDPVPSGSFAGETVQFSASWTTSYGNAWQLSPPYTVHWNLGGGAEPNEIVERNVTGSSDVQSVLLSNNVGGTFQVSVMVTDSSGLSFSDHDSYTYSSPENSAPVLSVSGGRGTDTITIHGVDFDGDDIYVSVTSPSGLRSNPVHYTIEGGEGDAVFIFEAGDFLRGGSGEAEFQAEDENLGSSSTVTANVVVPGIDLVPDTLYAIPRQSTATTADTVTIIVATGVPASPFQFMNGCRVTAPPGFTYVSGTFNVGAEGRGAGDVDGFWAGMNPGGGFLLPPDNFIMEFDLGGGLTGIDFNVTPIGGSDVTTDEGALFNFGATFAAGINTLGFQDVSGVNRTYYTDSNAAPDRFWGDITNSHVGIPNSVTVE